MKTLVTRTITGIFFVAAVIGPLFIHPLAFAGMIMLVLVIGLLEFYRMTGTAGINPSKTAGLAVSIAIYIPAILVANAYIDPFWLVFVPLYFIPLIVTELFRSRHDAVSNAAFAVFAVTYLALPLSILNFFFHTALIGEHRFPFLLIGFFVLLWANDIFAYLAGSLAGRHKFFERISPSKTWEGVAGGMIFTLVFSWVLSLLIKDLSLWQWLIYALLISVSGILGDLSESMLKRRFQVKDTGWILPGHGGILDRFDALFFAAPVIICYLLVILK